MLDGYGCKRCASSFVVAGKVCQVRGCHPGDGVLDIVQVYHLSFHVGLELVCCSSVGEGVRAVGYGYGCKCVILSGGDDRLLLREGERLLGKKA